jgi:hypothetical protein
MQDQPNQPPLPVLHEALLDEVQLRDLFSDLQLVAEVLEVRTKGTDTAHSTAIGYPLFELANRLWSSEIPAAQIVYTHEGRTWVDTLMRHARGVKVVRMQKEVSFPES